MGTAAAAEAVRSVLDRRLCQLQELTGLPVVFGGPVERVGSTERVVIEELRGNVSLAMQAWPSRVARVSADWCWPGPVPWSSTTTGAAG